jgi:hypothetical protein
MRGSDRSPPLFLSCAGGVTDGDMQKKRRNTSFGFLSFSFMDLLLSLQIFFSFGFAFFFSVSGCRR